MLSGRKRYFFKLLKGVDGRQRGEIERAGVNSIFQVRGGQVKQVKPFSFPHA